MQPANAKANKETGSKNRRGRPRAFPAGVEAEAIAAWGEIVSTKRGLDNKSYAKIGAIAICPNGQPNPRHAWFASEQHIRQAVLAELGRIAKRHGAGVARKLADELADRVVAGEVATTREAAAWLRRVRLYQPGAKRAKPATAEALAHVIITAVTNWMSEHPDATPAMLGEALSDAYSLVEVYEDMDKRKNGDARKSETVSENIDEHATVTI